MLNVVHSVTTLGTNPVAIDVEVHTTSGLPQLLIIGLGTKSVQEAKDRLRSALKTIGVRIKAKRTIINLLPAGVQKSGSYLDLAMAVGLLNVFFETPIPTKDTIYLGEVSLTGAVNPIDQCLLKVIAAKKLGFSRVIVPRANLAEVSLVPGITILGASHLTEVIAFAKGAQNVLRPVTTVKQLLTKRPDPTAAWSAVKGQHIAKRAAVISLAGKHSLHLSGPPGMGKTLIARMLHALMPSLTLEEAIETAALYSLLSSERRAISLEPPFRAPHSTASVSRLLGSSSTGFPGELALSHHGVLFLDELPSFKTTVLESLRVPLEEKKTELLLRSKPIIYPADCLLVTAANPCPCGYWGSEVRECKCSLHQRKLYTQKISGPLLDRIDLSVSVLQEDGFIKNEIQPVEEIQASIAAAKELQKKRYIDLPVMSNAELKYQSIKKYCSLESSAEELLTKSITLLHLSHRAVEKTISIAQTIADLEAATQITKQHLAEALQYRYEKDWQ